MHGNQIPGPRYGKMCQQNAIQDLDSLRLFHQKSKRQKHRERNDERTRSKMFAYFLVAVVN